MSEFQAQERVTTHFDTAAPVYGSWYTAMNPDGHSFRARRLRCMELLQKHVQKGSKVADIACGPATMFKEILDAGFLVYGTDIAPHMVEECRKLYGTDSRVELAICPADAIPLPDQSIQAVSAMGLLEYLNNEDQVLREFHRILTPQGIAILTYPHHASPTRIWNRFTHAIAKPFLSSLRKGQAPKGVKHREYHLAQTITQVENAGFKVEDVVFYNFKLAFRPLDSLFPKLSVRISEKLERFARTPILHRIGTGFILLARKK